MVAHRPGRPAGSERFFGPLNCIAKKRSAEGSLHEFEAVTAMKMLTTLSVLGTHSNHIDVRHLSDQISIAIPIDQRSELGQCLKRSRLITAINHALPVKWIARLSQKLRILRIGLGCGIISQLRILTESCNRIQPQSVDARIQPEPNLVEHGSGNLRIM